MPEERHRAAVDRRRDVPGRGRPAAGGVELSDREEGRRPRLRLRATCARPSGRSPASAPTSRSPRDFDAALNADGLVVPGVGAFAACMAGLEAVARRLDHRPPAGRRPPGAGHLRRHADPVRARRRARRGDQGPAASGPARSSRLEAAGRAAHGLEHRRRARRARGCSPASTPTPGSTSCTPTPCARWDLDVANAGRARRWSPGPTHGEPFVAAVENGAAVRPPSSTRRSPATPAPSCCATGSRDAVTMSKERARRRAERDGRAAREAERRARSAGTAPRARRRAAGAGRAAARRAAGGARAGCCRAQPRRADRRSWPVAAARPLVADLATACLTWRSRIVLTVLLVLACLPASS